MTTRFDDWQDGEVLDELDERGEKLSTWEIAFVEDLTKFLKADLELSAAQRAKLREIAEDRIPWE